MVTGGTEKRSRETKHKIGFQKGTEYYNSIILFRYIGNAKQEGVCAYIYRGFGRDPPAVVLPCGAPRRVAGLTG